MAWIRITRLQRQFSSPFPLHWQGNIGNVGQPDRQPSALSAGFALDWGLRWEEERGDSDILHRLLTLSPALTRPGHANTLTTLHITIMIAMDSQNGLFYGHCTFRFSSFFWHCKYLQVTCHWPVTIIGIRNFYRPLLLKSCVRTMEGYSFSLSWYGITFSFSTWNLVCMFV